MLQYASVILSFPDPLLVHPRLLAASHSQLFNGFPQIFAVWPLLGTRVDVLEDLRDGGLPATNSRLINDDDNVLTEEIIFSPSSLRLLCCILNPMLMNGDLHDYADRSQYTELAKLIADGLLTWYVAFRLWLSRLQLALQLVSLF